MHCITMYGLSAGPCLEEWFYKIIMLCPICITYCSHLHTYCSHLHHEKGWLGDQFTSHSVGKWLVLWGFLLTIREDNVKLVCSWALHSSGLLFFRVSYARMELWNSQLAYQRLILVLYLSWCDVFLLSTLHLFSEDYSGLKKKYYLYQSDRHFGLPLVKI